MSKQSLQEVLRCAEKAFATMGYDLSCCGKAADELDKALEKIAKFEAISSEYVQQESKE